MDILIVAGGSIDDSLLKSEYSNGSYDYIIGVDHGIDALDRLGITPSLCIGDFDSADTEIAKKYKSLNNTIVLNPKKDYTDTHMAVLEAVKLKPDSITIMGATGSRIDHVLGNISILLIPLKYGINAYILDSNNRIRLIDSHCIIHKNSLYGKYISCIPYSDRVDGIYLKGFCYDLDNASMTYGETIGISNELREEEGHIRIGSGYMLVLETKD